MEQAHIVSYTEVTKTFLLGLRKIRTVSFEPGTVKPSCLGTFLSCHLNLKMCLRCDTWCIYWSPCFHVVHFASLKCWTERKMENRNVCRHLFMTLSSRKIMLVLSVFYELKTRLWQRGSDWSYVGFSWNLELAYLTESYTHAFSEKQLSESCLT